jgi:hypothetical protein
MARKDYSVGSGNVFADRLRRLHRTPEHRPTPLKGVAASTVGRHRRRRLEPRETAPIRKGQKTWTTGHQSADPSRH